MAGLDAIWLLAVACVVVSAYVAPAIWFHEALEARHWFYVAVFCVPSIVFGLVIANEWTIQRTLPKEAGTYFGFLLAAAGWVTTNEFAIRNNRKQHTIKLITDYFTNAQRVADIQVIGEKIPYPTKLTEALVDYTARNDPFLKALDRELNFFEFLSAAILQGDMDERLARETLQDFVVAYYEQCRDYIEYFQIGRGTQAGDPDIWRNLTRLHGRWRSADATAKGTRQRPR